MSRLRPPHDRKARRRPVVPVVSTPPPLLTKVYYATWIGDDPETIVNASPFFLSYNQGARWASMTHGPSWRFAVQIKWRRIIA